MSKSNSNKGDILIVDDQPANLKILTTMLTEQGYRVRPAISGQLALQTARKEPPDLILLDILMPDMDGYELCDRLKADENTREIPIIFISVLVETQDKVKAFVAGGVDYVTKPFREEEVLARVETHLSLRNMQKQLEQEIAERKETEGELEDIFNLSPDMVGVFTTEGKLLKVNPSWEKVLGYTQKELLNLGWAELVHPDDVEKTNKEVAKQLKGIPVVSFVNRYKCKDGSCRTLEWQATFAKEGVVHGTARDITERVQAEEQIKATLAEKEVLLREVHHRVKNNLQVLIYLIDMQVETIKDQQVPHALEDLQGRIRAMALVHEKLYHEESLALIDFGDYLKSLTENLFHALSDGRAIAMRVDADNVFTGVNTAIPCGMIVNELLANALKHAFPEDKAKDRENEIHIKFESREGEYMLTVSDNGVGLPPELDWRTTKSLGLKLVNIWASYQLEGNIEVDTTHGTAFTIRFKERKRGGQSHV